MLVWRGRGIFVPLVILGIIFVVSLIFDIVFGEHFYGTHSWAQILSAAAAGIGCYLLGRKLNREITPRVLIDPKTNQQVLVRPPVHDFFYIKFEYWGVIAFIGFTILAFTH